MRQPNEIVLWDLNTGPTDISLFGPDSPKLIDPSEAINWIANGTFGDVLGPRPWMELAGDSLDDLVSRESGRAELAEELVVAAIETGRLRCVSIVTDQAGHPRVTYVDPQEFVGKEVYHEWDDGLTLQISSDIDDDNPMEIGKFWFLWDEIVSFAPRRPGGGAPPINTTFVPSPGAVEGGIPIPRPAVASVQPSSEGNQRGRGRPAGKNGEPIAMFVLRMQQEGIDQLKDVSDEALGAMLKEEYFRLSLKVPETTNAARDARGAMRALVKNQGAPQAEAAE